MRLLLLLLVLLTPISPSFAETPAEVCKTLSCVGIVDAGSTGSRFHIYSYEFDNHHAPQHITEVWAKKIKPGFATLTPDQGDINAYLETLFADAPVQKIPIYFYATAGMRLHSQPKQEAYYHALKVWFNKEDRWTLADAGTITGQDEGLYGWLAVNYQLGKLTNPHESLAGVMDMGGASVQVIFPVDDPEQINKNDIRKVNIYGRHINLFIHSFLGLGQVVLSQQFLDSETCFAEDYKLPTNFLAKGDADGCSKDIAKLINVVHRVNAIVQPAILQSQVDHWFAIGGLPALMEALPFNLDKEEFTNQNFLQQANHEVCKKSWKTLQETYPEHESLSSYCLFSSYYYALMVEGYGLSPTQLVHYIPSTRNTDWTLGVVLHQH